MTSEEPTHARYRGVIAATVTAAMLLQVAVQIFSGIREGFEPVNIVLIVISLLAAALNGTLFLVFQRRRRERRYPAEDDERP